METGIRPPIQMAVDSIRNLCLGYTGEANAQLIQIDVSKWQEKWPGASIDLMLTLPGEKASYPAKTELQDGKLLFLPGYGDTQKPGHGAAYVVATKDGTHLAASETVITEIMHKGRGGDELPEAPEAQAGWVADVLDAAHRAEEAAKRAENAQVTDEQVGKAVEDYLTENPVEFVEKDPSVPAWAKRPEKPTYTADEVGAQPKGDYALKSEIPVPYTLPTASADTLGGVKVGSGLRMDGDVLGVKSDEYELLETITIAEEGIKEIVRGGIALLGVRATMNAPVSSAGNDNAFVSVVTSKNQSVVAGSSYISGTYRMSVRYDIWKNGNIWDGKSVGYVYGWGGGNILGTNSASELTLAQKDEHIIYFRMYATNNGFPIGTVIKLYGVRK